MAENCWWVQCILDSNLIQERQYFPVVLGANPEQVSTGSRGYFGKLGSVSESLQSRNAEPFDDSRDLA